jgi:hypothetical protein
MKNSVFWDVMPCCSCKNRRFGGRYRLPSSSGDKNRRARKDVNVNEQPKHAAKKYYVLRLPVSANVVPTSPILVTLKVEAIHSSEALVLTGPTQCKIPEDGFFQFLFALELNSV